MTRLEKAIKLIVEDVKKDLDGYYQSWDIETWSEYIEATGRNNKEVKEDVSYMLNENELFLNDDYELETENGELVSYRQLMNQVRKQLKIDGYLK
jgi:hypothetical protein